MSTNWFRFMWLRRVSIVVVALFGLLLVDGSGSVGAVTVSASPYPVGDLTVDREDLTSSTFLLKLTNLNLAPPEQNRSMSQTWMVAGVRGRAPAFHVESANYIQLRDSRQTTETKAPDAVTQGMVRVADLGLFRQWWVYAVTVTVASNAGNDSAWILKDATIRFDLGEPGTPLDSKLAKRWTTTPGEEPLAGGLILNPNVHPAYYASDYNDPLESWETWLSKVKPVAKAGGLYKFSVYRGGVYRISTKDLDKVGSNRRRVAPAKWRIYKNGQEVPLITSAEASDAVFLPVASAPTDGLQEAVYWLDASGLSDKKGKPSRVPVVDSAQEEKARDVHSTASYSLTHRELKDYNPRLRTGPGMDRWFWADVASDVTTNLVIRMPEAFSPDEGTSVGMVLRYGFSNFPPVHPRLLMYSGGRQVADVTITQQQGEVSLSVAGSVLKPGVNPVAFTLDYPLDANPKHPLTLIAIDTNWQQGLPDADEDLPKFSISSPATTTPRSLRFDDKLAKDTIVLGAENGKFYRLPVENERVSWSGQEFESFRLFNIKTDGTSVSLEKISGVKELGDLASAPAVIITAPELMEECAELAKIQEGRGHKAVVLTTTDLYNIFSFGQPEPAAIRSALRYLFYKASGQAPEYVTLVGEASDFTGDPAIVPAEVQTNMVPASSANNPASPQGDQLYAAAIGSDMIDDFLVGRIPAASAEELRGYLKKMAAFDEEAPGNWDLKTEFAMDDNDEFPEVVERIVKNGLGPQVDLSYLRQWDFEYVPNNRVPGKKRSWEATQRIVDSFNSGLGVLNFFGHGGPNLWSHERLLHLSDLPLLTNAAKLPLISCASCDSAWISFPMPPVKASMGEKLVLKPDGGGIALFGPVAGASPYEHSTLMQSLMEGLTKLQLRRTGDLILYAKTQYFAITRSLSIPEQYLLLGDPTVSLKMPVVQDALILESSRLAPGTSRSVTLAIRDGSGVPSSGTLRLASPRNYEGALAELETQAGESRWEIALPDDFEGGAVSAALQWETTITQIAGLTFSVSPAPAVVLAETGVLQVEGEGYTIEPEKSVPAGGGDGGSSFRFSITSTDTTGPVVITAYANGKQIAEVAPVDIRTTSTAVNFDVTSVEAMPSAATTITLGIRKQEAQPEDVLSTITILCEVPALADLELVPDTIRVYGRGEELVANSTIFFEAEIRNKGRAIARNFSVQGMQDNPSTGTELQTINESTAERFEVLKPGESAPLLFRWENASPGAKSNIYLTVNRNKSFRESDYSNNSVRVPDFEVSDMGDFSIESFVVEPETALPGSTVTMEVVVRNPAYAHKDMPVTMEAGWKRAWDGETSSTRFPVKLADGYATITRQLIAEERYNQAYFTVNADREIEESNSGENTTHTDNMVVVALSDDEANKRDLTDSLGLGTMHNLIMPQKGTLRVSAELTSRTDYLLADISNVTTGSVMSNEPGDEDVWWVNLWRVAVAPGASPGALGLKLPVNDLTQDLPGILRGYAMESPGKRSAVDVSTDGMETWTTAPMAKKEGDSTIVELGNVAMQDGTLSFALRPTGTDGLTITHFRFYPHAAEWLSPPYMLPENALGRTIEFSVDTNDETMWQYFMINWRTGDTMENGSIQWMDWQSQPVLGRLPIPASRYLQIQIIGVPSSDSKPYLENLKLEFL